MGDKPRDRIGLKGGKEQEWGRRENKIKEGRKNRIPWE